ncbi:LysM peptidoglycan-binding domain-containing protein [Fodinicola acaciae]|uniref:CIS tube protein n=1 Tax=Fodinicola acaciae TaxID=2681555 RepID=UPI0013D1AF9D|nr:LysM peptidoglycan-binding domain-containing protein [Fodinicola acaciae]
MSQAVTFNSPGSPAKGGYASSPPANLQRATLKVLEPPSDATQTKPGGPIDEIKFQFNPKELTLTKTANWGPVEQRNAKKGGPTQFKGAQPGKLTLEMFLDATEKMDSSVVDTVEKLFQCCVPTDKSQSKSKASPPWVQFQWGGMLSFPGCIKSVTAKYTLFASNGTPIRAVCTINLEEISGEEKGQNPTSGSLAVRDVHTAVEGDTLASIANSAWGNPELWRELAKANDIDNPMHLPPGTRLLVPALEELGLGEDGGVRG